MVNRSKQKGTTFESQIVAYLKRPFPNVARRALNGRHDRGDIEGIPGVVIEAKNCRTMQLGEWVDEAEIEAENDGGSIGVVWHKRRGKGSPGECYVTMTGRQFVDLLLAVEHARNLEADLVAAAIKGKLPPLPAPAPVAEGRRGLLPGMVLIDGVQA